MAVFVDADSEVPYRLHFFEMSDPRPEHQGRSRRRSTASWSPSARNSAAPTTGSPDRFSHRAGRLPARPARPSRAARQRSAALTRRRPPTSSRAPTRCERRSRCQEERRHFVEVCRDYLDALVQRPHPRRPGPGHGPARSREPTRPKSRSPASGPRTTSTDIERTRRNASPGSTGSPSPSTAPSATSPRPWCFPPRTRPRAPVGALPEDLDPEIRRRSETGRGRRRHRLRDGARLGVRARRPSQDRLRRPQPGPGRPADRLPRPRRGHPPHRGEGPHARPADPPHHQRVVQGRPARRHLLALRRLGPARQPRPGAAHAFRTR